MNGQRIRLSEGMLLYHGSYTEVAEIDLQKCETGKDFGQGFYLTTSLIQAQRFIPLSVKKYNLSHRKEPMAVGEGRVSVYRVHLPHAGLSTYSHPNTGIYKE